MSNPTRTYSDADTDRLLLGLIIAFHESNHANVNELVDRAIEGFDTRTVLLATLAIAYTFIDVTASHHPQGMPAILDLIRTELNPQGDPT